MQALLDNSLGIIEYSLFILRSSSVLLQVGKHGIIIEFTDPDYNTHRSATYLPEVAAHEGNHPSLLDLLSHGQNIGFDIFSQLMSRGY